MLKNLNKNIKTSKSLNPSEPANIATIMCEVKQHGFYSAFCANVVDVFCHDEMMRMIKKLALNANLQVTFNAEETICIFEADDKA